MNVFKKMIAVFALLVVACPTSGCIGGQLWAEYNILRTESVRSQELELKAKTLGNSEAKALIRAINEKEVEEVKTLGKMLNLGDLTDVALKLTK